MLNILAPAMDSAQYIPYVVLTSIAIILMFIAAFVAIVIVMLQQSNSEGIQGITGSSETFFGKHKGKSIESKLKKWTWISLGILTVLSIAFYIVAIIFVG